LKREQNYTVWFLRNDTNIAANYPINEQKGENKLTSTEIKKTMLDLSIKQKTLAAVFKKSQAAVSRAINTGDLPKLKAKIEGYLAKRIETKKRRVTK